MGSSPALGREFGTSSALVQVQVQALTGRLALGTSECRFKSSLRQEIWHTPCPSEGSTPGIDREFVYSRTAVALVALVIIC